MLNYYFAFPRVSVSRKYSIFSQLADGGRHSGVAPGAILRPSISAALPYIIRLFSKLKLLFFPTSDFVSVLELVSWSPRPTLNTGLIEFPVYSARSANWNTILHRCQAFAT